MFKKKNNEYKRLEVSILKNETWSTISKNTRNY